MQKDFGRVSVPAKWDDINSKTEGEGRNQKNTDAEIRRLRKQTGLDTLVVLAVNDVEKVPREGAEANAKIYH